MKKNIENNYIFTFEKVFRVHHCIFYPGSFHDSDVIMRHSSLTTHLGTIFLRIHYN